MPTIQILDQAIVLEWPVGRGTVKKGILAGIAAMMLGVFIALGEGVCCQRTFGDVVLGQVFSAYAPRVPGRS